MSIGDDNDGAMNFKSNFNQLWRIFIQSSIALTFSIGGMFSGGIISKFKHLFIPFPWILALYPSILSLRGDISGVLSGKLGTMLHTGDIKPQFTGNTHDFHALIKAIFILTFIDSFAMGVLTFIINLSIGIAQSRDLPYFIITPLASCILATMLSLPITLMTAFTSFRRGLDPDIIVYPVVAILSDVIVAICYATIITLILSFKEHSIMAISILALLLFMALLISSKSDFNLTTFSSTLKEASPIVLLTSLAGVLNGVFLANFKYTLEERPEVLVVYPVILNALGGLGSILGSITTTRLALGFIQPKYSSFKYLNLDIIGISSSSIILHTIYGFIAYIFCLLANFSVNLYSLTILCIMTNLIGMILIFILSFTISIKAYNRGWDPDNMVIPIVSSISDFLGTVILVSLARLIL